MPSARASVTDPKRLFQVQGGGQPSLMCSRLQATESYRDGSKYRAALPPISINTSTGGRGGRTKTKHNHQANATRAAAWTPLQQSDPGESAQMAKGAGEATQGDGWPARLCLQHHQPRTLEWDMKPIQQPVVRGARVGGMPSQWVSNPDREGCKETFQVSLASTDTSPLLW